MQNVYSEASEDENLRKKNVSLPKITKGYQYKNPYDADNQSINHFDKEEKQEFQNFKAILGLDAGNVSVFLEFF